MNKIKSIVSDEFNITLSVTNYCNYSCEYCPKFLHDGSTQVLDVEVYFKFFTQLFLDNPEIENYPNKFVTLTGGEPTLYKGIEKLVKFFKEHNFKITLVSNGSAALSVWEEIIGDINYTTLSFHSKYSKFKKFAQIVDIAVKKNVMVGIGVVMDPEQWERTIEAVEHFKSINIPITYKGVLAKSKSNNSMFKGDDLFFGEYSGLYTPEQLDYLRNNTYQRFDRGMDGYDPEYITQSTKVTYEDGTEEKFQQQKLVAEGTNYFKGYLCDAGKSNLSIKWNGDIAGAHCGPNWSGLFGNIVKNPELRIKLHEKAFICGKDRCSCGPDMRISKSWHGIPEQFK
jgi:organic radical activating enzyme